MRKFLLLIAELLSYLWRIVPSFLREKWITGWLILDSRGDPSIGLRQLLRMRDRLDWVINERAMIFGDGVHPKHQLIKYHQFFIDRISRGESVLDVGCGYGAVSKSIARAHPDSTVVGIDYDKNRLAQASDHASMLNLQFVHGDATREVPAGKWDVVVLSNILEHIDDRVAFLKALNLTTRAKRFLIRVPMFERDWQMALRRDLGVDFRSDPDHRIEHTIKEFREEICESGLDFYEMQTIWGEIWADCRIKKEVR